MPIPKPYHGKVDVGRHQPKHPDSEQLARIVLRKIPTKLHVGGVTARINTNQPNRFDSDPNLVPRAGGR